MGILKKVLTLVAFLLATYSVANATEITIQSKQIPNWRYSATSGTVRVYADRTFTASNGTIVSAGNPSQTGGFYYSFPFTVTGSTVTIASGTIDSNTNPMAGSSGRYTAYFFSSTGVRLGPYEPFSNFSVKPIWDGLASGCGGSGTCTSWDQIAQYNQAGIPSPQDIQTYDRETIDRKINAIVASNYNFVSPLSLSGVNVSIPVATAGQDGYLTAANFSLFNAKENALTFSTGLNRSTNTISVVADTTRQLVNIENTGSSVGTRPIINFTGSAVTSVVDTGSKVTVTLTGGVDSSRIINTGTGLTGGGNLSTDRTLSVVADSTRQLVNIKNTGSSVGTRPILNFSGSGISSITDDGTEIDIVIAGGSGSGGHTIQNNGSSLTARTNLNFIPALVATDNAGTNATDITIATSPASATTVVGTGRSISTGTGLTGGGNLSADRTLSVVADSTTQRIDVQNNAGSVVGTRKAIQFINDGALSFGIVDDGVDNRIEITPTLSTSPTASATLVGTGRTITAGTGLTGGGDLSANRTLSVVNDTTTQKIDVQNNGGSVVGTRKAIQFLNNGALTYTITDDSGNNKIQIQPSLSTSGGGSTLVTTGRQVQTGTGLTGGGDLSSDRTLSVVADSTRQLINVKNAGSSVGTRPIINFSGTGITSIVDDGTEIDITISGSGGGIASINSLTAGAQFLVVGTSGSDFNISSSSDTHTFNLPDAGSSARGLINSTTQSLGGNKTLLGTTTFGSSINLAAGTTSIAPIVLQNGSLLSSQTAHTIEYNGTNLFFTPSSATRLTIATTNVTELIANKDTTYPGLTAGKLTAASYITELIGLADLTDANGTSGSGSTVILSTITTPSDGDQLVYVSGNWINQAPSGSGITSLNGLTAATQTFATGTSGSDFNISSTTSTHTFNLPDAGAAARGLLNSTTQTIGGAKTLNNTLTLTANTTTVAPLKFQAGSLLTTPVAHSLEWDGSKLYVTTSVPTRKTIATEDVAELVANKGIAGGYIPSNGSNKIDVTYTDETLSAANLTTWVDTSGTGDTALRTTITTPSEGQALIWSTGNWVNGVPTVGGHALLSTAHTDTTAGTVVRGDLITGQEVSTTWKRLPIDTNDNILINDGTDVVWGKVNLASATHVTGVTPTANGGSGLSSIGTANQVLGVNNAANGLEYKTITAGSNISVTHGANSITIAVTGMGTGTVTHTSGALTANSFIFGNGSDDIKATAAATDGQILIGDTGSNPVAATLTGGTNIGITNGAGSITVGITGQVSAANGGTGVDNTGKTITLGGNFVTSGANSITLTSTGATNVTLPTSGTLTTLAGSEALTNKTINGLTITSTTGGTLTLANSSTLATSGANSITLTSTGATNVTLPTSGTLVNTAVTSLSSLAGVGNITSGTWSATAIAVDRGGTNTTTYTKGDILVASASTTLTKRSLGTDGQVLTVDTAESTGVKWATAAGMSALTDDYIVSERDILPAGGTFTTSASGGTNTVYIVRFTLDRMLQVSTVHMSVGTGSVGNNLSFGIYSNDGNTLLVNSGTISTTSTGIKSVTLGSPVTLNAGVYLFAYTTQNTTMRYAGFTALNSTAMDIANADITVFATAANSASSGALPSTTGALTPVNSGLNPMWVKFQN